MLAVGIEKISSFNLDNNLTHLKIDATIILDLIKLLMKIKMFYNQSLSNSYYFCFGCKTKFCFPI